jgi:hypothetical protein
LFGNDVSTDPVGAAAFFGGCARGARACASRIATDAVDTVA